MRGHDSTFSPNLCPVGRVRRPAHSPVLRRFLRPTTYCTVADIAAPLPPSPPSPSPFPPHTPYKRCRLTFCSLVILGCFNIRYGETRKNKSPHCHPSAASYLQDDAGRRRVAWHGMTQRCELRLIAGKRAVAFLPSHPVRRRLESRTPQWRAAAMQPPTPPAPANPLQALAPHDVSSRRSLDSTPTSPSSYSTTTRNSRLVPCHAVEAAWLLVHHPPPHLGVRLSLSHCCSVDNLIPVS